MKINKSTDYIGAKCHKKWFVSNSFDPLIFQKKESSKIKLSISTFNCICIYYHAAAAAAPIAIQKSQWKF